MLEMSLSVGIGVKCATLPSDVAVGDTAGLAGAQPADSSNTALTPMPHNFCRLIIGTIINNIRFMRKNDRTGLNSSAILVQHRPILDREVYSSLIVKLAVPALLPLTDNAADQLPGVKGTSLGSM